MKHSLLKITPKLHFPQKQRAFAVPEHLQAHTASANDLLANFKTGD